MAQSDAKYLQGALASGEVLDMGMEWSCVPVEDWGELVERLARKDFEAVDFYRGPMLWESDCDIYPDFGPDPFSYKAAIDFVQMAQAIERYCAPEMREAWGRVFFAISWEEWRKGSWWKENRSDYLTWFRELHVPEDLPESNIFGFVNSALSPTTVARLAQWSRELPLEDYQPCLRCLDTTGTESLRLNRFQDWEYFEEVVRW